MHIHHFLKRSSAGPRADTLEAGLSSIVELSRAQYQQTDAAIGNTNAQCQNAQYQYEYRLTLAALNYQIGALP
jgi:outer membrane protein